VQRVQLLSQNCKVDEDDIFGELFLWFVTIRIRNINIIIIVQHIPKAKDTRFLKVKY